MNSSLVYLVASCTQFVFYPIGKPRLIGTLIYYLHGYFAIIFLETMCKCKIKTEPKYRPSFFLVIEATSEFPLFKLL